MHKMYRYSSGLTAGSWNKRSLVYLVLLRSLWWLTSQSLNSSCPTAFGRRGILKYLKP